MLAKNHNLDQNTLARFTAATVVGLGVTGYSAVRYLRARGLSVSVVDSRIEPPLSKDLLADYPEVTAHFGSLELPNAGDQLLLVISPGVSLREASLLAAKRQGATLLGDIELFLQENTKPVIAVTGSNGKSTVVTLVGEMCRAGGLHPLVAGNIGKPALDALTDREPYDVAVLELSSFQLETTQTVPASAAAILNVSADHMDRYDSMGDYTLAKARVLRGAERAVLPRHDEQLTQITSLSEVLTFGSDEPSNQNEYGLVRGKKGVDLMRGDKRLMRSKDISLTGSHNVSNVLSAFALVDFLDMELKSLAAAVKQFPGLPHRMQTVLRRDDVIWVNDSKATNVGATSTALQSLDSKVVWLAGGEGKGADFSELRSAITRNVKTLLAFGADAPALETALADTLTVQRMPSMQAAVEQAHFISEPGDVVLLSPACASFDMFDNFEHRGEVFAELAKQVVTGGVR